jgi:hypothetical protein
VAFSTRLRHISQRVAQALCEWIAGAVTVGFRFVIGFMRRPVALIFPNADRSPDEVMALEFSERNTPNFS